MSSFFISRKFGKILAFFIVITFFGIFFSTLQISNGSGMYLDDSSMELELRVLFDESHIPGYGYTGLNTCLDNSTGYELFVSSMVTQGFIFDVVNDGSVINESILINHDIFIICSSQTPYSVDEINTIYNWTSSGGSLLLMGDHTLWSAGVASLANKFGYTFIPDMIQDFDDHMGTPFWPVFDRSNLLNEEFSFNVQQLAMYGTSGFATVAPGSDRVLFTDNDNTTKWTNSLEYANNVPIICKNSYWNNSAGKIAILGETNLWTNEDPDNNGILNYNEYDNSQLAINIMNWLATPYTISGGLPLEGAYLSFFMIFCLFIFIERFSKISRKK